jgi:hypothetical protein
MVFQFRLRNLGQDGGNPARDFFIESRLAREEKDNYWAPNDFEIGPDYAKYVAYHNGSPMISQIIEFHDNKAITRNDGALGLNVKQTQGDNYGKPEFTANEAAQISDATRVISGVNQISILNAAGKTVTVTNVLGQTVAKTVATSDNATITLPKGIVVVSVDGKSTKAVVK